MSQNKFPTKNFWGRNGVAVSTKKQQERILNYMKKHGSISSSEAYHKLGISQLSVRISELEAQGVKIKSRCNSCSVNNLTYFLGGDSVKKER